MQLLPNNSSLQNRLRVTCALNMLQSEPLFKYNSSLSPWKAVPFFVLSLMITLMLGLLTCRFAYTNVPHIS